MHIHQEKNMAYHVEERNPLESLLTKPHTNSITKRFSLLKGREVDRNIGTCIDIVLVRLLQRKRINKIYRDAQKEIYYEELADEIMEVEMPPNLPSASWGPREATGFAPVHTWRPENLGPLI